MENDNIEQKKSREILPNRAFQFQVFNWLTIYPTQHLFWPEKTFKWLDLFRYAIVRQLLAMHSTPPLIYTIHAVKFAVRFVKKYP